MKAGLWLPFPHGRKWRVKVGRIELSRERDLASASLDQLNFAGQLPTLTQLANAPLPILPYPHPFNLHWKPFSGAAGGLLDISIIA